MRVGLVGAGPWAQMFTAPLIRETEGLELAAVWTRRRDAGEAIGGPTAETFEDLLEVCEAVAFAVPPDVQASMAVHAARAGRHVLLDKPLARHLLAAEAVAEAVGRAGVVSQLLLTNRYKPGTRAFLETVARNQPRHITCTLISGAVLEGSPFATPWRVAEPHALLDLGPHTLDLVQAIAGPVLELSASDLEGMLSVRLIHRSGCTSEVTLSASTPGADGSLRCAVVSDVGTATLPAATRTEALQARSQAGLEFAAACKGSMNQTLDAQHGVELQRLLDAVGQALEANATVTVTA